jgi:membrane-bound lytic murein transglycosylase B
MIRRSPRLRFLAVFAASCVAAAASASAASPEFEAFLASVRQDALAEGISAETVDRALAGVEPIERIIQRDRNQAEFTLTLDTYMSRVVTEENIARGRALAQRHRALLEKVAQTYNVQPRFILAIWGMETRFGAVTTTTPVIPALATLAFDARRPTYFRTQLMAALKMVDRGYIDLASMTGSWAGAMGQVQFMPDSYLNFAVDFDGDGKRDIWHSTADVFASIANYLAQNGWRDDQTWGRRVKLPGELAGKLESLRDPQAKGCRALRELTTARPLPEWQQMGVRRADGGALPARAVPTRLVTLDNAGGASFAVYPNYQSILAYNCAHLYAITVGTLADRIGES